MSDNNIEKIKSDWHKRETILQVVTIFMVIKDFLDLIVNFIALIPAIGFVAVFIYNITFGFITTLGLAAVSFSGKFTNKAIAKKVVRLVVGFFGETIASFLPMNSIIIIWTWYEEKKEFKEKISKK